MNVVSLLMLLWGAPQREHPADEMCRPMTANVKPCSIEQIRLTQTPHVHDKKGNIILLLKNTDGTITRITVTPQDWKRQAKESKSK